jgi:hypothetical protein
MDETPVPVRFVEPWLRLPPTLAAFLPMTWYWADAELRAELQASIEAMVRRDPGLLAPLRARTRTFRAPSAEALVPALELAGLLLSLWALGDELLRGEVERMVREAAGDGLPVFPSGHETQAQEALAALRRRVAP